MLRKESSRNGGENNAHSVLMDSLLQEAKRRGRQDVLGSFCERYLTCFSSQLVANNTSPEAMFDVLVKAIDIREELHDIERRMDKNRFSELLAGGYFVYGNIDKKTGLPVAWLRYALAANTSASSEAGGRKYIAGTPHSLAYLRAVLFFYEIAQVQALSRTDKPFCALYLDMSDRRVIDYSPSFTSEFLRLAHSMFPTHPSRLVVVAGGIFMQYILKTVKAISKRANLDAIKLITRDEVFELVEDPGDVPAQWLRDGRGKAHSFTDRKNQWCYERCLQDAGKITTKDVFNPGTWPYAEEEPTDVVEDVASSTAASVPFGGVQTLPPEAAGKGEMLALADDLARPLPLETIDEESGEEW